MARETNNKMSKGDALAREKLLELVERIYNQFENEVIPSVSLPSRTKANIEYSDESDVWVYGDRESERSAKTVKGAFQLLKTVYATDFLINEHLAHNRGSTLRELYYISEGWVAAKFKEQAESDRLIEDLELLTNLQREFFHMRPEEDG